MDYGKIVCRNIAALRRKEGLTQEQLADRLGVTYQAVSKWETGVCCPDITSLPLLAQIFQVSVDRMFAPPSSEPTRLEESLPWEDDGTLRAAVFIGQRLMAEEDACRPEIRFVYEGPALNVESRLGIECGDVLGNADAGGGINCGNVGGYADAGGGINCGNVEGDVNAGGGVNCGNVEGFVDAGGGVNCGNVEGDVNAGGSVSCGMVEGGVSAGDAVECKGYINGSVQAGGDVKCGYISGSVIAEGNVLCSGAADAGQP